MWTCADDSSFDCRKEGQIVAGLNVADKSDSRSPAAMACIYVARVILRNKENRIVRMLQESDAMEQG